MGKSSGKFSEIEFFLLTFSGVCGILLSDTSDETPWEIRSLVPRPTPSKDVSFFCPNYIFDFLQDLQYLSPQSLRRQFFLRSDRKIIRKNFGNRIFPIDFFGSLWYTIIRGVPCILDRPVIWVTVRRGCLYFFIVFQCQSINISAVCPRFCLRINVIFRYILPYRKLKSNVLAVNIRPEIRSDREVIRKSFRN